MGRDKRINRRVCLAHVGIAFVALFGLTPLVTQGQTINSEGIVSFRVNFPAPPTQENVTLLKEELRRTNNILCDATDGQVRFGKVTFSSGMAGDQAAEIIAVASQGRSYSTGAQNFLYEGAWFADVLAHELGHSLLGLGDQYDEQQRMLTGCGFGRGFDLDVRFDEQWNTIMQQQWGSVCRTADGKTLNDFDPYWTSPQCRTNADCFGICRGSHCPSIPTGQEQAFTCEYVPSRDSELSVPINHDLRRGTGGTCPSVRPGKILLVEARLDPDVRVDEPGFGQPGRGCGDGEVGGAEQCDRTDLSGETCVSQGFTGGWLRCHSNCSFDTSQCTPVESCGDNSLDSGESCDAEVPSKISCTSKGFNADAPLTCDANCGVNLSQCPGTSDEEKFFDGATLESAIETSDAWTQVRLIDEKGEVGDVSRPGPSVHSIYLFFHRTTQNTWALHLAGPAEEYVGGKKGRLRAIGTLSLTINNAGKVSHVDGEKGTLGRIEVGGTVTGAFAESQAKPVSLEVRLDKVEVRKWTWPKGNSASSFLHWNTRIVAGEPGTASELQLGRCTDERLCKESWNTSTGRYEATHHTYGGILSGSTKFSDWEWMAEVLKSKGFNLKPLQESALPVEVPPLQSYCDEHLRFDSKSITYPNQVLMVLDRSGSMSEPVETLGGIGRSRLEYVQSAAETFVLLQKNTVADVELGLLSFNQAVHDEVPLKFLSHFCGGWTPNSCERECVNFNDDPKNCGACSNECASGEVCSLGTCAEVCTSELTKCGRACVNLSSNPANCGSCGNACAFGERCESNNCVPSSTPLSTVSRVRPNHFEKALQELEAEGGTAAGDALREAESILEKRSGVRAVLLLTDGESNVGEEPAPVIKDLTAQGIEFYLIPTGPDAPQELGLSALSAAPDSSMAALFDARSGREVPAAFFEVFARSRSESLIRGRTLSAVSVGPPIVKQRLDIGLIPPTPVPDHPEFPEMEEFSLFVESLAQRLNVLISSDNAIEEPWLPRLRLIDPTGKERLNDESPEVESSSVARLFQVANPEEGEWKLRVSARSQAAQRSMLLAHVESPHPNCRVRVTPEHVKAGDEVSVIAHAFWGNQWIAHGVKYQGQVTSPDGSVKKFSLTPSSDPLMGARGSFKANGNVGLHEVRVTCDVSTDAVFGAGEVIFNKEEPYGPNPGMVQPFYREAIVHVPVRDLTVCSVEPSSIACCKTPFSCPGTKNIALFAGLGSLASNGESSSSEFSAFELADRAKVMGLEGKPTEIVNAGPQRIELGVGASVLGSIFSVSEVFARERALVSGQLTTEQTLVTQNDVVILGGVNEGSKLTLPESVLEAPEFPPVNWGDRHLEPDVRLALRPGAYGNIVVKSRATLQLEAGTYWLDSLQIEPQAIVRTSGMAPTRIFVQGNILLKETVHHTSGKHDRLLIMSLGEQEIFVEKPLSGTLIAPNTSVILSGPETSVHRGAVFAQGVRLRAGVTLEHHGFPWTWIPGGIPVVPVSQSLSRVEPGKLPPDKWESGACQLTHTNNGSLSGPALGLLLVASLLLRRRREEMLQ